MTLPYKIACIAAARKCEKSLVFMKFSLYNWENL